MRLNDMLVLKSLVEEGSENPYLLSKRVGLSEDAVQASLSRLRNEGHVTSQWEIGKSQQNLVIFSATEQGQSVARDLPAFTELKRYHFIRRLRRLAFLLLAVGALVMLWRAAH